MVPQHRRAVPRAVTDVLLWLLASDVAAAHHPHPQQAGRCAPDGAPLLPGETVSVFAR
ncbi:hypothetical protein [Salinispora arenicola]|uniref:hypothetical protein n=1 Tax=Salinispora arenicola TaxID=168697 RepID=UPI0003717ED2|nr:hypothetical protein [Salinispora arenicola]